MNTTPAAGEVDVEPVEHLATAAVREPTEPVTEGVPCWPVTRLVGWALMLALGLSNAAPAVLGRSHGVQWVALVLPALVATLSARALFEALASASGTDRLGRHALASVLPAALAVALMAGAQKIVGTGWSPVDGALTGVLTVITLTAAGTARGLEIRVRLSLRRVYFIGSPESRRDLERELSRRHDARLVGAAAVSGPANRAQLVHAIIAARATVVVLDSEAMRVPELVEAASQLNLAGLRIRDLVSYYEYEFKKVPLGDLPPAWFLFDIAPIHRRPVYRAGRMAVDVGAAAVMLLFALPFLLAAMIAIRLTSRGPVLYHQRRVGKDGAPFTLVKLRTMTRTTDTAAAWAPSQAHRVTRVGRLLRRFRLDELPQLGNVIRGDLALVGPRPEQVPIVERLDRELPHYNARHCIRPGLTGWAQVNLGYAGSAEGAVAKLQRDLYYIKHTSLRLDLLILWLTFKTVIAGRG